MLFNYFGQQGWIITIMFSYYFCYSTISGSTCTPDGSLFFVSQDRTATFKIESLRYSDDTLGSFAFLNFLKIIWIDDQKKLCPLAKKIFGKHFKSRYEFIFKCPQWIQSRNCRCWEWNIYWAAGRSHSTVFFCMKSLLIPISISSFKKLGENLQRLEKHDTNWLCTWKLTNQGLKTNHLENALEAIV